MIEPLDMYDYHVWANRTMFNRLRELPPEAYRQEVRSIFSSIAEVMAHMYTTDHSWLEILNGTSMYDALVSSWQPKEEAEAASFEELEAMYESLAERFRLFIHEHTNMEKTIVLDNPYVGIRDTRLSEIVMQVVNHGTYHRGNVSAMLRQMGHASVMTEYALFWYQEQTAASRQPSARI